MNYSTKMLLSALLLSGIAVPTASFASKANVEALLQKGGLFMFKNRRSNLYASVNGRTNAIMGASKRSGNDIYSQIWIVKPMMPGHYYVSSALNLNYLTDKPEKVSGNMLPLHIFYSGGNASDKANTNYVTISWSNKAEKYENPSFSDANDKTSLNEKFDHYMAGWHANRKATPDEGSDWELIPVTNITTEQVRANIT